ncbi:MAG TPA: HAD-IA family hydrolase [Rhodocyclaceae bacterium]|jgi:phosphoglycolate phosphatase|nr:HAD-IA family hydrolase [Rhodocyclaceae bacterium]
MEKRFDLIVFDWDGTLMDSAAAIVHAVQQAARDLDLAPPTDERARHIIGLGLLDALEYAMPGLARDRYEAMVERYRYHYLARDHELVLFPGARELVVSLAEQGYMLAVATGKTRVGLDRAWAHSGIGPIFHDSRCADECHSKPHPQMLLELMDAFGVVPERTLMIGDTTHDLNMANSAGTQGLGVSYGAHPRSELVATASAGCVDSVAELSVWLNA